MKITPRNGSFGSSFLYDKSGQSVFQIDVSVICLVGKDNMREPSTWWFYQDKYKNSSNYLYGNISFTFDHLRITIK
jgi:hypothetical protein